MENTEEYKSIFFQIINGYTPVYHSCFGHIYLKHLTYIELSQLDVSYTSYLMEAKSKGILTFKEKESQVVRDGLWKDNDEIELDMNQKIVQDLRINYSKDYLASRRKKIKKDIDLFQNKVDALKLKKAYYIGQVAEDFAGVQLIYNKIVNSFFADKKCSQLLIVNDEIDEEYDELRSLYYTTQEKLCQENIKKVALFPFFMNIYTLCQDDAHAFYGKSIVDLTNYQADLASYGRYFKHILSERQDIPKEVLNDPNQIIEWIEIQDNAKKAGIIGDDDTGDGSKSIVGASSEDLKLLGIKTQERFSLRQELEKHGGKLNSDQLYNLTK